MGGGDKSLLVLGGRPLLAQAIERLKPQTHSLAINANGDPDRFSAFGLPVIADRVEGYAGPLAGILAGMEWAATLSGIRQIVSMPADTPFFPEGLVFSLQQAAGDGESSIAVASSDGNTHPPIALWPLSLRDDLARFLAEGATRKVSAFAARHHVVSCAFPAVRIAGRDIDPFLNVNTPAELLEAENILAGASS